MSSIIDETSQKLVSELKISESILWWAQPEIRLFAWPDIFIIPFSCIWASLPIGAMLSWGRDYLLHGKKIDCFLFMWMFMFALIGLYITVGRFIHLYIRQKMTYYIITTNCVGVLSTLWPKTKRILSLNELTHISVIRKRENHNKGSIYFEEPSMERQLKASASVPVRVFNRNLLIFYDLPAIDKPLAILKDYFADKSVKIDDIVSVKLSEIYQQIGQALAAKRSGLQEENVYDQAELIQVDNSSTPERMKLSTDEKEQSVAMQRRFYIGRSLGMLSGVIFAFIFSYNALGNYKEQAKLALESEDWPSTKGKIEKLEIIRSKGDPYLRSFKVSFTVHGRGYTCEKYSYADYDDKKEDREYQFGNSHKEGDVVDVYYDANNPDNSVLQNHPSLSDKQEQMAKGFFYIGVLVLAIIVGRLVLYPLKTFEPKALKEQSLAGVVILAAFLSVWASFFFGAILTSVLQPYIRFLPPMPFQ